MVLNGRLKIFLDLSVTVMVVSTNINLQTQFKSACIVPDWLLMPSNRVLSSGNVHVAIGHNNPPIRNHLPGALSRAPAAMSPAACRRQLLLAADAATIFTIRAWQSTSEAVSLLSRILPSMPPTISLHGGLRRIRRYVRGFWRGVPGHSRGFLLCRSA